MRRTLAVSVVLFAAVTMSLIVLNAAGLLVTGAIAGAAFVLAHTGGLDAATFETCQRAAATLVIVTIVAIVARAIVRRRQAEFDEDGDEVLDPDTPRPVGLGAIVAFVLLVLLVVVTALGWSPSPYFPYTWTTVVVLANIYYFAVYGPFVLVRLGVKLAHKIFEGAARTPYKAGATTAGLVLIAGLSVWGALAERDYLAKVADDVTVSSKLDEVYEVKGVSDAHEKVLCLVADRVAHDLARGPRATACKFLP